MIDSYPIKNKWYFLADDDQDDREIFVEAVAEVDPQITVKTFINGFELMQELRILVQLPNLIFLDLNMPVKNGRECIEEIKQIAKLRSIPVAIYSTSLSHKEVNEDWTHSVKCFIRKPNTYSSLKDIIAKIATHDFSLTGNAVDEKVLFNI
jgi:CheY-like chemotaxis protein